MSFRAKERRLLLNSPRECQGNIIGVSVVPVKPPCATKRGKEKKKVTFLFCNNYSAEQINQQCDCTSLLFKTFYAENNSEIDFCSYFSPAEWQFGHYCPANTTLKTCSFSPCFLNRRGTLKAQNVCMCLFPEQVFMNTDR